MIDTERAARSTCRAASALAIVLCLGVATAHAQVPILSTAATADARLRALYEREWAWRQREFGHVPIGGERGNNEDHLPRVDAASQATRLAYWRAALRELDGIDVAALSREERINAEVLRATIEGNVTDTEYKSYEAPFNADTFFWTSHTPRDGFETADQYRRYIGRLNDIPRYFDDQIANMRAGLKRGFTVPRVATAGRDKSAEPYLQPGEVNPYWAAIAAMPEDMAESDRARICAEAETAIRERVIPAYRKLLAFLRTEYMPRAREDIAATSLPGGKAYYQALIRKFTTLDLTAEQIHAIGLKEVARIRADMEATRRASGFEGSMPEFLAFLRSDPRFYARTPKELLAKAAYAVKGADYRLKGIVGTIPRFRHGILPVPPALAPIYTGGRGGLEACLFNTYNLPVRPLYTLTALALHEGTPGHSFQAALELEAPARPDFRKAAGFSGYGEGWALYMEWLGTKLGMYETPYDEFGRETYEMWRAARLVIDTGIHQFGWSRQRAIDYLRDNTALSEHEITTEVDRYIAWPAQALAYKLGELQIRRQRAEAEKALGTKFDQRIFHDVILQLGSVPLPTLERVLDEYIAAGGRNPAPWPQS
ncbi:DUF885 family protein [Sphingosinicella sp. BN140058]|uniref:DUF885 domain-containing protein n=1 Tax=Sphingosinicella sp. BN140058 TaxID=1892855 RepID=UPI001013B192|nr:DUF885 family protein [Sphingosinicella sp. BN140058]QAY78755.1 DUF885 family protein [Sphingosinicella sp. BN140058]